MFLLSFVATTLELPGHYGPLTDMISSALNVIMIPIFGHFSDRIGRKKTFLLGAAVIILTAWPIFELVKTRELWLIVLGVAMFLVLGHSAVYAVLPSF